MSTERLAIEQVVQRYLHGLDARDVELVLSTFADDATLRYMDGALVMRGRDEARAYFSEHRGPAHLGITELVASTHLLANGHVEVAGGEARCRLSGLVLHRGRMGERDVLVQRGLRYDDRLVRDPERGWLVTERLHGTAWQHVSDEAAAP